MQPKMNMIYPELVLADLLLKLASAARDQMKLFVHFAEDLDKVTVVVTASKEQGLQLILTYPVTD